MQTFERHLEDKVYKLATELGQTMGHLENLIRNLEMIGGNHYFVEADIRRAKEHLAQLRNRP